MRKILLLLIMLISTALSMSAEGSYSIVFKKGSANNNTAATTTTFLKAENIESGIEYISRVTTVTKIYPHWANGLKFGSSNRTDSEGILKFNLADNVKDRKVTKIELTCSRYSSDTGHLLVNSKDIGAPPTDEGVLTCTYDTPTALSEIEVKTSTKRAYVRVITVYYETEEVKPLGALTASVNGVNLEVLDVVGNGMAEAIVPANASLTVGCENARSITVGGTTYNDATCTIPVAFANGTVSYSFTISNGGEETKTLDISFKELGLPLLYDGVKDITEPNLTVKSGEGYDVKALNAEKITVSKDGAAATPVEDGMIEFTEGGTYVFTATAGEFTTTSTYTVAIANTNTPAAPVVTLNGAALNNGSSHTVLLNSTVSIACADATDLWVLGPVEDIIEAGEGTFKITKPGEYTFYGSNDFAPQDKQEGPQVKVTFALTLGNPSIKVESQAEAVTTFPAEVELANGGENITVGASDAEGAAVEVTSVQYKIGEGEYQTVEGNTFKVTDFSGSYTFTAKANEISTPEFTVTFSEKAAPLAYEKVTDVAQLLDGSEVIIGVPVKKHASKKSTNGLQSYQVEFTADGSLIPDNDTQIFILEKDADGNYYLRKKDNPGMYLANGSSTNVAWASAKSNAKATITIENDGYSLIVFAASSDRCLMHNGNSDFKNYNTYSNWTSGNASKKISLYTLPTAPQAPTMTLDGEAVTDFSKEIVVKAGSKAVFSSTGAKTMVVNGREHEGDSYTVTFAEEGFVSQYTVTGKNAVGESEPIEVKFTLDLTPANPVVAVGEQTVTGDVNVTPGEVMTVTAPEGTVLVYTKGDVETVCEGNTFSYTFTSADYILNADGTVSATPVAYTFKARKGEMESETVTLNVTVQEPAIVANAYRLVTSAADLQDGKKYLMVAKDKNIVGRNDVTTKINGVSYTIDDNPITATDDMLVLELEWQAATNDWKIKSNNISGATGYQYMTTTSNEIQFAESSSASNPNFTITIEAEGVADIRRNVSNEASLILYNNQASCFRYYKDKNKNNANYATVQLYVQEEGGVKAGNFEEFLEQSKLHPGKEVKFVNPLTITAHFGNQLWMKDEKGTHVYATYTGCEEYHMGELIGNRTFWNFSGKAKAYNNVAGGPIHVEITSLDHEYEMEVNGKQGKVPYMRQLEGDMDVPVFSAEPKWWEFGQMEGTLVIDNGKATFTSGGVVYPVLTDLATLEPEQPASFVTRRYDTGLSWKPGDKDFFTGTHTFDNAHMSGTIMPDAEGNKAVLAMQVSGETITGVDTIGADDPDALVNVYNMQGICLRSGVRRADALTDLPAGLYIMDGRKVLVKQ